MKKILLGTTAVVALGTLSTEAFAADKIKLGLGGFMRHYVGVINDDEAAAGTVTNVNRAMSLSQDSNTEVYFSGSTTLDNGLSVAATVQLEADGEEGGNSTDESYLSVSSDALGQVYVGVTGHALGKKDVFAPNAGNFDWTDLDDWAQMADTTGDNTAFTFSSFRDIDGDNSAKLGYISPSFSGFSVVASYSAAELSSASDADSLDRNASNDGSSYGLIYSGELGGATVKGNIGQYRYNGQFNTVQFGASVGMAGFTVGGSYTKTDDDDGDKTSNATTTADGADGDGKQWDLGVAYATGPYSVSASYMQADNDGDSDVSGDNEDSAWRVAGTYDMGAGVALTATWFQLKRDRENSIASPLNFETGKSAKVNGVIAGIEVGF